MTMNKVLLISQVFLEHTIEINNDNLLSSGIAKSPFNNDSAPMLKTTIYNNKKIKKHIYGTQMHNNASIFVSR